MLFAFRDFTNTDVESLTLQSLNVEMPKWAQRRLAPDQISVHVTASSVTTTLLQRHVVFCDFGIFYTKCPGSLSSKFPKCRTLKGSNVSLAPPLNLLHVTRSYDLVLFLRMLSGCRDIVSRDSLSHNSFTLESLGPQNVEISLLRDQRPRSSWNRRPQSNWINNSKYFGPFLETLTSFHVSSCVPGCRFNGPGCISISVT
jgi:hypothetical protein